jgi:hypothetical protein
MPTKYKKYRSFLLPKEIVDSLLIAAHIAPLQDNKESEIIVGLAVIHDILSKSNQYNRSLNEYHLHCIPMDSRYLQLKYGNDYHSYIHWLIIRGVIWHDYHDKGRATHYYLQAMDTYSFSNNTILNRDGERMLIEGIISTYCLRDSIEITLETIGVNGINGNQKNRINELWYRIKVPITKTNKKFLTKDYEVDSREINNASKHFKKMGSHFRKNLKIDYEDALSHSSERYKKELDLALTQKEEMSAYRRYSSRIVSVHGIHNGSLNKTLRFKRNDTNKRLDTNLTNMASDLRKFIIGYENMTYLDLSNSQPVLFNVMLNQYRNNASESQIKEIDEYFQATLTGKWYELLMEIYNIKYIIGDKDSFGKARDKCKKLWMLIAYSKNEQVPNKKLKFANRFPFIYSIIVEIKAKNYSQFAISLQIIESEIFIDEICKKLVNEGIIPYTLHDGLLVPFEHQQRTLEIMSSILEKKIGAVPNIKIENYKSQQIDTIL